MGLCPLSLALRQTTRRWLIWEQSQLVLFPTSTSPARQSLNAIATTAASAKSLSEYSGFVSLRNDAASPKIGLRRSQGDVKNQCIRSQDSQHLSTLHRRRSRV